MNTISLPQLPWHGMKELKLSLPDSWQVELYHMAGWNRPAMKPEEIKAAITNPIGIAPIRELARGKNEVVIIFDDMTRATRLAEIAPFVLEELSKAGIPDNKIRFVCALGCHGAHNRLDFAKKLGEEILARFPVYNHNPFAHCTYVGTTNTYKTKVYINEEVMKCDLKIGIGLVVPHPASGFGGGGKIILPGVASYEAIEYNHRAALEDMTGYQDNPPYGMGIFDNNPLRFDIEEVISKAFHSSGSGQIRLHIKEKQLTGSLAVNLTESLPLTLNFTADRERIAQLVNRFKNHPSLLCWEMEDEPAFTWNSAEPRINPEPLIETYRLIKQEDPHHPVITNHGPVNLISTLAKYNRSTDIVACDVYPVIPHGIEPTYALYPDGLVRSNSSILVAIRLDTCLRTFRNPGHLIRICGSAH